MLRLYVIAIALALAAVACAGSTRASGTTPTSYEEPVAAPIGELPVATRYKLDAIRVDDSPVTYQGTLVVRGVRATLVVNASATSTSASTTSSDEREFVGTIEHDDITMLAFDEGGQRVGELECVEDGTGMSCMPRDVRRMFGTAHIPMLRFERISLHAATW